MSEITASIYIASSSTNIDAARALGARMQRRGCIIEHEWWNDFDAALSHGWTNDSMVTDDFAQSCAWSELSAVARCDAVVFLDSEHKSDGASLEIGYALASGKPVFVLGEPHGRIWERLDEWVHIANEHDLIIALRAVRAQNLARATAERRGDMSDLWMCKAIVTGESDKAVQFDLAHGGWRRRGVWIPRSILHDDNEVNHIPDTGKLIVPLWWAVQEGLQMGLSMPSSPLAVQKSISEILSILEDYASIFDNRNYFEDALCDCGQCPDDVIGYHVGKEIRTIVAKVKSAT